MIHALEKEALDLCSEFRFEVTAWQASTNKVNPDRELAQRIDDIMSRHFPKLWGETPSQEECQVFFEKHEPGSTNILFDPDAGSVWDRRFVPLIAMREIWQTHFLPCNMHDMPYFMKFSHKHRKILHV